MRLKRLVVSVLDPQAPCSSERWQAIMAIVWGLWLLLPWETFRVSVIFIGLESHAPEWVWGLATLAAGLLAFGASYNGPGLRVLANLWMVLGWAYIAAAALHSVPPATIGALLAGLALKQVTLFWDALMDWQAKQWTKSLRP